MFVLWQRQAPNPSVSGKRPSPIVILRLLSGRISAKKTSSTSTLLPVKLRWSTLPHASHALLDFGAEGNFIDHTIALKLQIPLTSLTHPIAPFTLNGHRLPIITHITEPVSLITLSNHTEDISFYVMDSPLSPIVQSGLAFRFCYQLERGVS